MSAIFNPLAGLEIEFHLVQEDGAISNEADFIITHPERGDYIVQELSKSMIEVLCKPSSNLLEVAKDVVSQVNHTLRLAKLRNLSLLPSTPIGNAYLEKRRSARYDRKNIILGDEKRALELQICGTHIHIDKYHKDIVKQHSIMTALDPLFALMSSSPFFKAQNSLNNYRAEIYRKVVFEHSPDHGKLLPYANTVEELQQRQQLLHSTWVEICKQNNVDGEGFTLLNSCWGPIRFSEKTIESRSCDTNLVSNVMALAAAFTGFNRQLDAIRPLNGTYLFDGHELPTYEKLVQFQDKAITNGIQDIELQTYLKNIITFAEKGLADNEKFLLEPFKKMLASGKNMSDEITEYAKINGHYIDGQITEEGSTQLRLYLTSRLEVDLNEYSILLK